MGPLSKLGLSKGQRKCKGPFTLPMGALVLPSANAEEAGLAEQCKVHPYATLLALCNDLAAAEPFG